MNNPQQVIDRTKKFEGSTPHMYLDADGIVNVGAGSQLPTPDDAAALPFIKQTDQTPATANEKREDWINISQKEKGKDRSFYERFAKLRLKPSDIDNILRTKLEERESELENIFPEYGTFPQEAQEGLLDMAYNLGVTRLLALFPKFLTAVRAKDWHTAAEECGRARATQDRNNDVRNLFKAAENSLPVPSDRLMFFDVADDFLASSNPSANGIWSYGFFESAIRPIPGSFQLYKNKDFRSEIRRWNISAGSDGPGIAFNGTNNEVRIEDAIWRPRQFSLLPGSTGEYCVVRWKAPATGVYRLAATFIGIEQNPIQSDAHIFLNNEEIFGPEIVSDFRIGHFFDDEVAVAKGDTVDFVVGFGADRRIDKDTTALSAKITIVELGDAAAIRKLIEKTEFEKKANIPALPFTDVIEEPLTGKHKVTSLTTSLVAFHPNAAGLFPGAVIRLNNVPSGILDVIEKPRSSGKITVTDLTFFESQAGNEVEFTPVEGEDPGIIFRPETLTSLSSPPLSQAVLQPSLSSINQAINSILTQKVDMAAPVHIFFDERRFFSLEHALTQIGADASFIGADLSAKLSTVSEKSATNLMVQLVQAFYTVSFAPDDVNHFFADEVSFLDMRRTLGKNSPLGYISTVTYGRLLFLFISSQSTEEELKAAVRASLGIGFFRGSADLNKETTRILEESEIKALILGGKGDAVIPILEGNGLTQFLKSGVEFNAAAPGVPILYEIRSLKDNTSTAFAFEGRFVIGNPDEALVKELQIVFQTTNENKDSDSGIQVFVSEDGTQIGISQILGLGQEFEDGSTSDPFPVPLDRPKKVAEIDNIKVQVEFSPNGNDEWHTSFTINALDSLGIKHHFLTTRVLTLSEDKTLTDLIGLTRDHPV